MYPSYQPNQDVQNRKLKPFSIAWLFPHVDLPRDPSNRLRRYQISNYLKKMAGIVYRSENIFFYDKRPDLQNELLEFDVVVFFNINDIDLALIKFLNEKGKLTIFDHAENIFGMGQEDAIMRHVSAITCCSTNLAKRTYDYLEQDHNIDKPVFVIRDPLEDSVLDFNPDPQGENVALIMGMGANVQYVIPTLEGYCNQTGYKMLLITEAGFTHPYHKLEYWTPYTWMEHAMQASVALCFHNINQFPAKGNVKVTTPMSLGLPVIACPIEAYSEAISNGRDGFIASTDAQWLEALSLLKDKDFRTMMGLRARQSAIANYKTEKITMDYLAMIADLQD